MKTKIEWATDVWNPVTGCTKVSEGCRNCYAERMVKRFGHRLHGDKPAGVGIRPREFVHVQLHPEKLDQPLHWRKPRRVFVCSMGDLFHEDVPWSFIVEVFLRMNRTGNHTFMVLTKRPERMREFCSSEQFMDSGPLANVWLGVSVEDQKTADERIPLLLQTPAALRFVSCEPMLGPVKLWRQQPNGRLLNLGEVANGRGLDWVICGGESGPGARPMHPEWARSLRDQCAAANVPFFFKQWGEWAWASQTAGGQLTHAVCRHGHVSVFNGDDMRRACAECTGWEGLRRVGKKAAGRELDGMMHDVMPGVRP